MKAKILSTIAGVFASGAISAFNRDMERFIAKHLVSGDTETEKRSKAKSVMNIAGAAANLAVEIPSAIGGTALAFGAPGIGTAIGVPLTAYGYYGSGKSLISIYDSIATFGELPVNDKPLQQSKSYTELDIDTAKTIITTKEDKMAKEGSGLAAFEDAGGDDAPEKKEQKNNDVMSVVEQILSKSDEIKSALLETLKTPDVDKARVDTLYNSWKQTASVGASSALVGSILMLRKDGNAGAEMYKTGMLLNEQALQKASAIMSAFSSKDRNAQLFLRKELGDLEAMGVDSQHVANVANSLQTIMHQTNSSIAQIIKDRTSDDPIKRAKGLLSIYSAQANVSLQALKNAYQMAKNNIISKAEIKEYQVAYKEALDSYNKVQAVFRPTLLKAFESGVLSPEDIEELTP